MLRLITLIIAVVYFSVGLLGFFKPNLMYLVQFDLFQSFSYLVVGAIGLQISLSRELHHKHIQKYLSGVAIFSLGLMMLGLSWPNLADIVHLEVPEHFFHGTLGLTAALTVDYYRRQN